MRFKSAPGGSALAIVLQNRGVGGFSRRWISKSSIVIKEK
jgi:hypothetical protein